MSGKRIGDRGFTLMEVVLVAALVGLVFLFAAARLDGIFPKYRIRGEAREIGWMLKEARSRALGSGKDVYVVYDLSGKAVWMLVAFPPEDTPEPEADEPPPTVPRAYVYKRMFPHTMAKGVSISGIVMGREREAVGGTVRLRFSSGGLAEHHIINLEDEDGRELAVKFNGFTGTLSFHDGHLVAEEILEDREP